MSIQLHRRLERLERDHEVRVLAAHGHSEPRRWVLLNLYVRACAGEDVRPWREALADLPCRRVACRKAPAFTETERSMRVLALVCREARTSARYAELLAVAVEAGLASERQARWIAAEGLQIGSRDEESSRQAVSGPNCEPWPSSPPRA